MWVSFQQQSTRAAFQKIQALWRPGCKLRHQYQKWTIDGPVSTWNGLPVCFLLHGYLQQHRLVTPGWCKCTNLLLDNNPSLTLKLCWRIRLTNPIPFAFPPCNWRTLREWNSSSTRVTISCRRRCRRSTAGCITCNSMCTLTRRSKSCWRRTRMTCSRV